MVLLKDRVKEFRFFPQSYKRDVVPGLAAAIEQLKTMRAAVQLDSVTTTLFDRSGDAARKYQGFMIALEDWTRARDAHLDSLGESTKEVARLGDELAALIQEVLEGRQLRRSARARPRTSPPSSRTRWRQGVRAARGRRGREITAWRSLPSCVHSIAAVPWRTGHRLPGRCKWVWTGGTTMESRPDPTPAADVAELAEAVENYRRAHPEVDDALRIFEVSEQAYQAAIEAMSGPHVSWSNATNPSAT